MNPLISMIAQQANSSNPAMNMLSQFNQFRQNWTPAAAQSRINEMLRSGQINAQQYEQARQMAEQFKGLIK